MIKKIKKKDIYIHISKTIINRMGVCDSSNNKSNKTFEPPAQTCYPEENIPNKTIPKCRICDPFKFFLWFKFKILIFCLIDINKNINYNLTNLLKKYFIIKIYNIYSIIFINPTLINFIFLIITFNIINTFFIIFKIFLSNFSSS